MKKILLLTVLPFVCLPACRAPKQHRTVPPALGFEAEIAQYRAAKIEENTKGDRHPLDPGDEQWLQFYPPQQDYRVVADFSPATDTAAFDMLTYSGAVRRYQRFGQLEFLLNGQKQRLTLYRNLTLAANPQYKHHLFLPFKDATNGSETYKGGRYLDMRDTDIQQGKMPLDFNRAYNPWCAYSDGYNCPVPPSENHLKVAIKAGEMNYRGGRKTE